MVRSGAVDVFYAIFVMKLLNKSCKFCRNNCFGAINLSVNYSVMGQLLRIALRAKAWHVRKPHWNALLSAQGMTTVCNVTAVYTDWIIRHILPRRTGHWVCRAYTVAEQHLLIRWAAEGSLSLSTGPVLALNPFLSILQHPGDISVMCDMRGAGMRICQLRQWLLHLEFQGRS